MAFAPPPKPSIPALPPRNCAPSPPELSFPAMFRILALILLVSTILAADAPVSAPAPKPASPYDQAIFDAGYAERKGLLRQALEKLDRAREIDPKRVESYFLR